ncbi:hypothetical protein ATX40_03955 [Oenococcus oeni]|nr:hypothetical protein ATX40_03955 [Oenococcus oeni]
MHNIAADWRDYYYCIVKRRLPAIRKISQEKLKNGCLFFTMKFLSEFFLKQKKIPSKQVFLA